MNDPHGNRRAKARRALERYIKTGSFEPRGATDWASVYDRMALCELADLVSNGKTKLERDRATAALARRVTADLVRNK